MTAKAQIALLANYIMAEIPGEPSRSEGAGDTAVRLLKDYRMEMKYNQPQQGMDWSIEDKGDGKVLFNTRFPVMQIGELKSSLQGLVKRLDEFAKEKGVPNDLDGRGRKR